MSHFTKFFQKFKPLLLAGFFALSQGATFYLVYKNHTSAPNVEALENGVVVLVDTDQHTMCSGAIVDSEGLVLTANHCIPDSKDHYLIFLKNNPRGYEAKLVMGDSHSDLALVRMISLPDRLTVLPLASRNPHIGDPLWIIGYPLGKGYLVTKGLVGGLEWLTHMQDDFSAEVIRTDAAINPGNSGGPALNQKGQIVGIVSTMDLAWVGPYLVKAGIGECISIDEIHLFLDHTVMRSRYAFFD